MASNLLNHPDLGTGQHGWLAFELVGLLAVEPQMTQRGLAERLGVSLGTVNGVLRQLARSKVVVRSDSDDAALKGYVLTEQGKNCLAQSAQSYFAARTADIERATSLLSALRERIDIACRR